MQLPTNTICEELNIVDYYASENRNHSSITLKTMLSNLINSYNDLLKFSQFYENIDPKNDTFRETNIIIFNSLIEYGKLDIISTETLNSLLLPKMRQNNNEFLFNTLKDKFRSLINEQNVIIKRCLTEQKDQILLLNDFVNNAVRKFCY